MPAKRNGGPDTAACPSRQPRAGAARTAILSLTALCVVAGLAAGCGSASTPREKYENCLSCGYTFG